MTNKKPIVGISGSLIIDEGGMFPGYERAYVNNDYVQSVAMCGGVPYIVPMVYNDEIIREQVKNIDALILSGGHDVNPLNWGEEPHQKLGGILPKRDAYDFKLLKYALEMKKPILGICRGEQVINVCEGGSLYQDLSLIDGCYIKHNQGHLSNVATHTAIIREGTKLHNILGESEIHVNSFHHLSVNELANGYIVCAESKDGVIEAIEKEGEEFVLGIQWHPEMMTKDYPIMQKLFKALITEATK
ncbi:MULTISPECIES: gamma-glutamyl-gamma-aminobutyrate hydrolase family protein [unclassified Romboutsia]|uniref:gamma-glutamyl-gamma-aminobutyrate hydrolase family protein n=1 Tax=unclassified Romboutsia TaxID=2626894 RepID=UPI0018976C60|nr:MULTISPECIES: gamma-glutamyl-gamma-aminobutyrate hydrolase family protein [unclassified Romboutsia]MDB8803786.1 gamma-glutamyl-gamma-aminobutyrate hydrolase family protein [Romboutsia sp. 1001216sp1]MDB8806864.1 gamma-glutamyl-gamma-aminobutyrate hydrolase family protein [Romboutsia sp. 1001216sp1]MDB8809433.1 gamma-glutamyl-gamma-aminobutyrate hydrolase family protein [Romboutsia sp. 1001216sp1]MDB8815182.1 gamma-glutamyl-gamma-aminobutyrate hydrolase family protein [Romboutsia sp. 1001216s